ncbi:MAG: hypothetical protein ACRD59_15970 [Candidatus Acidiferrales bacterium]
MTQSPQPEAARPAQRPARAITILYWCVGLVVLIESCLFVFSASRAQGFAHSGMPHLIRPVLGGAEIVAALLFLTPPTRSIGGYALLVVFAAAALIHILHGQFEVGGLIVYAAAVYAVLAAYKS